MSLNCPSGLQSDNKCGIGTNSSCGLSLFEFDGSGETKEKVLRSRTEEEFVSSVRCWAISLSHVTKLTVDITEHLCLDRFDAGSNANYHEERALRTGSPPGAWLLLIPTRHIITGKI
jgi:hypothetical protein